MLARWSVVAVALFLTNMGCGSSKSQQGRPVIRCLINGTFWDSLYKCLAEHNHLVELDYLESYADRVESHIYTVIKHVFRQYLFESNNSPKKPKVKTDDSRRVLFEERTTTPDSTQQSSSYSTTSSSSSSCLGLSVDTLEATNEAYTSTSTAITPITTTTTTTTTTTPIPIPIPIPTTAAAAAAAAEIASRNATLTTDVNTPTGNMSSGVTTGRLENSEIATVSVDRVRKNTYSASITDKLVTRAPVVKHVKHKTGNETRRVFVAPAVSRATTAKHRVTEPKKKKMKTFFSSNNVMAEEHFADLNYKNPLHIVHKLPNGSSWRDLAAHINLLL